MSPRKSSRLEPKFLQMPPQKMAIARGKGRPDAKVPKTIIRYVVAKRR